MNINIGRINEGLYRGLWGDYENEHVIVSVMKHHVIVTLKAGVWTEILPFRVRDCSNGDYECVNGVINKLTDNELTAVLCL